MSVRVVLIQILNELLSEWVSDTTKVAEAAAIAAASATEHFNAKQMPLKPVVTTTTTATTTLTITCEYENNNGCYCAIHIKIKSTIMMDFWLMPYPLHKLFLSFSLYPPYADLSVFNCITHFSTNTWENSIPKKKGEKQK